MSNSVLLPSRKEESEHGHALNAHSSETGTTLSQAPPHALQTLTAMAGNRSAQRVLAPLVIQPKLTIGAPDDVYEKEADAVAEQVMLAQTSLAATGASRSDDDRSDPHSLAQQGARQRSAQRSPLHRIPIRTLQQTLGNRALRRLLQQTLSAPAVPELSRKCALGGESKEESAECSKKRHAPQRSSASADDAGLEAPPIVEHVLASPGQPLAESARRELEPGFGHDFSAVRVHDDSQAADSAAAINALAYTVSNHIAFGTNQYAPGTRDGNRLLAHELTHTIQQTEGTSLRVQTAPEISLQSDAPVAGPTPAAAGPVDQEPPSGGCPPTKQKGDPRFIADNLCLLSEDLKDDPRLNDAFHNNPPLTAADNGDPVSKFQQALLDVGEKLPNFGADGQWGDETTKAVVSFQSKNGIPPGGFEAGRKTLKALDAKLQQNPPPPPPPPPSQSVTLNAQCGSGQQTDRIIVSGSGFPPGEVELAVDRVGGNSAIADSNGFVSGSVPAQLKDGSHVVKATAGGVEGTAEFTTPCGGQSPPLPDPKLVTQNELLVLTKYQFMEQTERDATEDAIRDLRSLDTIPIPFLTALIETVGETVIQFVYGSFEQVLRTAVKGLFPTPNPDPKKQDPGTIVDNAHDKASDFLEDFGKDGLKDAIKEEHDAPVKALEAQLEGFRRPLLAELRQGYFKLSVGWIQRIHSEADTKDITADELQGLAKGLDQTGQDIYKLRYNAVVQGWASYIAQSRPGAKPNVTVEPDPNRPGKFIQVSVTSLPKMDDDTDPAAHPGVLFIHIFSNNVKPKLATTTQKVGSHEDIVENPPRIDQQDIRIFGLSEPTRAALAASSPTVGALAMPVVFRGDSVDGGAVAIAKDEAGTVRDKSKDPAGSAWLTGAGQDFTHEPNPDAGALDLFNESLNVNIDPGSIKDLK